MIKKIFVVLFLLVMFLIPKSVNAYEDDVINVHVFWGEGCPHCEKLISYLEEEDFENVELHLYETYRDFYNNSLYKRAVNLFDIEATGVPLTIIGDETIIGFGEGSTDKEIERIITRYKKGFYNDTFGVEIGISEENEYPLDYENEEENIKNLPILGEVNIKEVSVLLVTIVLGAVDGFNPCAMWVLLFLISMLIGMKDRKRMWILGLSFIGASAFIYFLFMTAWLNVMLLVGTPRIIQIGIGIFAIIMAGIYLKDYYKGRKEGISCKAVKSDKKNKIIERIKKFTHEKSLLLALGGIIILAISVNTVELFCSLGLPVIYAQILNVSGITGLSYYLYILLYVLFFMIDDILIFAVAMVTLKITGLSTKYSVLAKLIGGLMMLAIGILMIFAPEALMF